MKFTSVKDIAVILKINALKLNLKREDIACQKKKEVFWIK